MKNGMADGGQEANKDVLVVVNYKNKHMSC
jgi:hypothetical protein